MNLGKYPTFIEKPIKDSLKPIHEVLITLVSAFLVAVGTNLFLVPHHLLSGGITGVASIIGYMTGWNISLLYFVLNLPLIVWGWRAVGRRYILLSCLSVVSTTWFMAIIP
ncbi:YitT family protein [Paenibacillus lautus]